MERKGLYRGDVRMVNVNTGEDRPMPWGYATSDFAQRDGWIIECPNYDGPKPNNWGKQVTAPASPLSAELERKNAEIEELRRKLAAAEASGSVTSDPLVDNTGEASGGNEPEPPRRRGRQPGTRQG